MAGRVRVRVFLSTAAVALAVGGCSGSGGTKGNLGTTNSGGSIGSGDTTGAGGRGESTASGGTSGLGGATASGGADGNGTGGASVGLPGTDGGAPYQGPCDLVPSGCAEAYSVTRAMTASYTGPLFQLARTSDKTTQDVGQTASHAADLTTWSSFCGGTQSIA